MTYLLDNDVFFASIYGGHVKHRRARQWLDEAKPQGWGIATTTYLAGIRLLMNPAIMQGAPLTVAEACDAVETELSGVYPGRIVGSMERPDRGLLQRASGHRQVMDIWLVQVARQEKAKLATFDGGLVANWPDDCMDVLAG